VNIESMGRQIMGLLTMHRIVKERIEALELRQAQTEQAILELDAALRRSGVLPRGSWALSLRPRTEGPDRQSADAESTIST
jgi:hypothetical protein